jgi:hypothetical protein
VKALATMLVLVVVSLMARGARADDVQYRRFAIAERGTSLVVSVSFADVIDTELLAGLDSGFATTVVVRAYVFPDGVGTLPVFLALATFRLVYDLWEEQYQVQIDDGRGRRRFVEPTLADALKRVASLDQFPVAPLDQVPVGQVHFIGLIVEVNPVSPELLGEVRKWLAKGADRPRAAGDSSIFGSFVSIFVNPKVPEADRVLKLRSQRFYRTGPVKP